MAEKINVELDESFINKLFEMTDTLSPQMSEIDLQVLKKQLYEVGVLVQNLQKEIEKLKNTPKSKRRGEPEKKEPGTVSSSPLTSFSAQQPQTSPSVQQSQNAVTQATNSSVAVSIPGVPFNYAQSVLQFITPDKIKRIEHQIYDDDGRLTKGRVLIIDDLGVITYQLSVLFKHAGFMPVVSKEIYDAIDKFKCNSYDMIVMDLYIPTEREGFIMLDELKKIATVRNEDTVIGVMSASTRKDYKKMCDQKGAAFYVEKVDDWQKELFGFVNQYLG